MPHNLPPVEPLKVFGASLNSVQAPARYLGGEYGAIIKPHSDGETFFNFAVAFPDLYEIGMSNLAVKIIYNALNARDGIRCERVFAPDTDFERLLKEKDVPLYTLETGMPLCSCDMIGFSVGYELGITEVLAMLEAGRVPLLSADRGGDDPIVIAGGCGVTNPAPIGSFFDAIMIGEAEPALFTLTEELSALKKSGAGRSELMALIESKPFMWTRTKSPAKVARRAVQADFGLVPSVPSYYPLPALKPVQDHGVVEIMRGCPNGCRFCHAGIYYRPARIKNSRLIIDEIDHLVFDAGYREISLNSLSSADFPGIGGLLDELNARYKGYNVSFQLPSLKVNSMSLPVLEKLSAVRRSGLTFAVETPDELWQLSLNKEVYAQHLESIIREAKAKGWSTAKFYFMIGLPLGDYFNDGASRREEEIIADFLLDLQRRTRIQCSVSVGIFIPKPHTPYQWVRQITPDKAQRKLDYLYKTLPRGKFKIGKHNLFSTVLEGLMSRGDERAGELILSAFRKGARLDAWDEHLKANQPIWESVFSGADWSVEDYVCREWSLEETLPWEGVSLGPAKSFYKKEWERSLSHELTPKCQPDCNHKCGICNQKDAVKVHEQRDVESLSPCMENKTVTVPPERPSANIPVLYRVNFAFRRCNGGEFTAYLSQVEIFHKAIIRSRLPFVFTAGFNPLPRLEFATAMSLGIPSCEEVATAYLYEPVPEADFMSAMNGVLPESFAIFRAQIFPVTTQRKRESLSEALWGQSYSIRFRDRVEDLRVAAFFKSEAFGELRKSLPDGTFSGVCGREFSVSLPKSDKALRLAAEEFFSARWWEIMEIRKTATLAKPQVSGWTLHDERAWREDSRNFIKGKCRSFDAPVSYFTLFEEIARINAELIADRENFMRQSREFYSEHPELAERHGKNK